MTRSVESRSALDQNTSWVIVGYPRWRFIQTRSLVNYLSLVNCLSFLRNEQVVPDGFESLYERFTTRRDRKERDWRKRQSIERSELSKEEEQVASWKVYARKGQDSCNYSYRLSKTEQLRSGFHRTFRCCFVILPLHNRYPYFAKWRRRSVCSLDRVHLEA